MNVLTIKKLSITLLLACILFTSSTAQKLISPPFVQESWSKDYEPFRIAGNLYYVGTYDLASYLITTSKGNILINTGLAESVPMIKSHIEKLGYRFSDIKILLTTHAHYDHVGGMAMIKKMTGAKMMINERDASVLADGGNSDYSFGGKGSTFKPINADRLLHDQDTVELGDMQLVVLNHPGHTKGASSFLFHVKDDQHTYQALIANMPTILDDTKLSGMPTYPEVAKDYAYTLDALKKLNFDIWFASHASQFALHRKHKPGDDYSPEVFRDRNGYDAMVDGLRKTYLEKLDSK